MISNSLQVIFSITKIDYAETQLLVDGAPEFTAADFGIRHPDGTWIKGIQDEDHKEEENSSNNGNSRSNGNSSSLAGVVVGVVSAAVSFVSWIMDITE